MGYKLGSNALSKSEKMKRPWKDEIKIQLPKEREGESREKHSEQAQLRENNAPEDPIQRVKERERQRLKEKRENLSYRKLKGIA